MKNLIILLVLTLSSCVKDDCVDYLIENKTNTPLEVITFENGLVSSKADISSNSYFNQLSICDWGGNSLNYSLNDSIQVKVNNTVRKTYFPNGEGKNIYKTQDRNSWRLVEENKHYSKFVFEITEQDLQ